MTLASTLLLSSIPILVHLYATRYREEDLRKAFVDDPPDFGLPVAETFDFIVVGGGTAGCVVARRLADENYRVLLLEAGGNPVPLESIPIISMDQRFEADINFLYQSTPQKNAALRDGGILHTSAGKMLGGSSSHHEMIYERGHPVDYDEWANMTGDPSWKYANVLQYFKKSENYQGRFTKTRDQHGIGGPMTVSRPLFVPGQEVYIAAGKELGLPEIDPNGPQKIGVAPLEFYKNRGRRVDTYTGYIKPIEEYRKNLFVRRYSLAEQIIFENKTAVGVVYRRHTVPRYAIATREVIVATGAYISPILLIKSGIGPEDQVRAANVTPVQILPGVGKNLMDHPIVPVGPIFVEDLTRGWLRDRNLTFQDSDTFINQGDGPLSSFHAAGVSEAYIASSRAANSDGNPNWPDLQVYNAYLDQKNAGHCNIGFNRPYSRGEITLNTSATGMEDNFLPIIEYNYYTVDSDFNATIDGINYCLTAVEKTEAFRAVGAKFTTTPIPECANYQFRSDDYWRCYIRQVSGSTYHASGTCRMGKADDPMTVVDSKLKVIGVKNLRVIDASIMPRVTNANTCAPTIMIAEKGAYDIIQEQRRIPAISTTTRTTRATTSRRTAATTTSTRPTRRPLFPFFPNIPGLPNFIG